MTGTPNNTPSGLGSGRKHGKWLDEVSPTGRRQQPMEVAPRHITVDELLPRGRDAIEAGDNTFVRDAPAWTQWCEPPLTIPEAANDNWPKVVAFTGLAGSGKSTAADYLVSHGYQRVKFAGPLKAMMRAMGLSEDHIEGPLKELPTPLLAGRTPRYAMQTIGTDWGRDLIGPTLWTGLWYATVSAVLDHGGRVVCDDCRFANEAESVRAIGGKVIRLEGRGGISGGHVSERMEFEADRVVANIGDTAFLERGINTALRLAS